MAQLYAYLIRHGTTLQNERGHYRGWLDDASTQLNVAGKDAARNAALYLKAHNVRLDSIYYSDLGRAHETAEIIAKILGKEDSCYSSSALRPLNVGKFQGQSKAGTPLLHFINHPNEAIPSGESVKMFEARTVAEFQKIRRDNPGLIPIIIVHTSNIVALWNHLNPHQRFAEEVEEVVSPGGIVMWTSAGLVPLYKETPSFPPYA